MQKTLSVINLRTIRQNALKIRKKLDGRKFFAVVKADAYGHGAEEVSRAIEDIADCFCVALIEEGVALRVAGITKPVLVLAPPLDKWDADRARFYNLTVTVNSAATARLIGDMPCHIKVNTGMNRYGCSLKDLPSVLSALKCGNVQGVYSHLYASQDAAASRAQLELFDRAEALVRAKVPHICAHIAASGGFLRGGKYLKDGARCGILIYGYAPSGFGSSGFRPALKVYARRAQFTEFAGGGIGYNRATETYGKLSVYRLGYADGFPRTVPLGEKTLCMDAFIKKNGSRLQCVMSDADEFAARYGTISYEVLTSVTHRSEKVYIK